MVRSSLDTSVQARARVHAALADPVRLMIVDELALSDRAPGELAHRLGVASNLLAHHLGVLEDAGLVERSLSHGDRRRRYLRLRPTPLTASVPPATVAAAGVVFVCTHNSARSQLAAALWARASAVPASSGGTEPAPSVHPRAVEAARREGLDLRDTTPRPFSPEDARGRVVVTVCDRAHEQLPGERLPRPAARLHWSIPDPALTGRAATFDSVTAELSARVAALAPAVTAA